MTTDKRRGTLVISVDFELLWGFHDLRCSRRLLDRVSMEHGIIPDLLRTLTDHCIPSTWAIVGALADSQGDDKAVIEAKQRFTRTNPDLAEASALAHHLWHADSLCSRLAGSPSFELSCHGHTHSDWRTIDAKTAELEVLMWQETARNLGVTLPRPFIYPRNGVAHLDVLRAKGFECYRGPTPSWRKRKGIGGLALRVLQEARETTETFAVPNGVPSTPVDLPGTMLWRRARSYGGWDSTERRSRNGLDLSIATGTVFHVWFHPINFTDEYPKGLVLFSRFLDYARLLRDTGRLDCVSMGALAGQVKRDSSDRL